MDGTGEMRAAGGMMKGKWRIASILGFAILHGVVAYLSFQGTLPIIFSRFDSLEPYTFQESMKMKITFLLLSPYYLILYVAPLIFPRSPFLHGVLIVGNSLLWGVFLDWVLGKVRSRMALGAGTGVGGEEDGPSAGVRP